MAAKFLIEKKKLFIYFFNFSFILFYFFTELPNKKRLPLASVSNFTAEEGCRINRNVVLATSANVWTNFTVVISLYLNITDDTDIQESRT